MATQAQMNANRANAQKSTGPTSDTGKAYASQNAFKTGIYAESEITRHEDPEQLAQLTAEFYADHIPSTAAARELVDNLIDSAWRSRRLRRGEARLYNHLYTKTEATHEEDREGHVLEIGLLHFLRLDRIRQTLHRNFTQTLDKLQKLETAPARPHETDPQAATAGAPDSSTAQPPEEPPTSPEFGFVSSDQNSPSEPAPHQSATEHQTTPSPEPPPADPAPDSSTTQPTEEPATSPEIGFVSSDQKPASEPDRSDPAPEPPPAPPSPESSTAQLAEEQPTSPETGFVSSSGERFASQNEWRAFYRLSKRHPLNHRECPNCRLKNRNTFYCHYEPKRRGYGTEDQASE